MFLQAQTSGIGAFVRLRNRRIQNGNAGRKSVFHFIQPFVGGIQSRCQAYGLRVQYFGNGLRVVLHILQSDAQQLSFHIDVFADGGQARMSGIRRRRQFVGFVRQFVRYRGNAADGRLRRRVDFGDVSVQCGLQGLEARDDFFGFAVQTVVLFLERGGQLRRRGVQSIVFGRNFALLGGQQFRQGLFAPFQIVRHLFRIGACRFRQFIQNLSFFIQQNRQRRHGILRARSRLLKGGQLILDFHADFRCLICQLFANVVGGGG